MATLENWLNRRKGKNTGDLFKLDTKNKTPEQNIVEIIQGLYVKKHAQNESSPTSKSVPTETRPGFRSNYKNGPDSRRMSYLNALVTLLCKEDRNNLGFTSDELMTCLRISLVDDSMLIRATALRVLRYLIKTENDVATFNTLKLPYLVMRSMDLVLRNEEERAQALRVVRRVVGVAGAAGLADAGTTRRRGAVDRGLLRCLVAVARAGTNTDGTGDRMARPAIATLAEICVVSPSLVARCGGVCAVRRAAAECATPRMAEALCGALLHAAADPAARSAAPLPTPPALDLTYLSAPYCDFHVSSSSTDSTREDREMRFTCSRLALVCVLRSWPGLLHYCRPRARAGLPALVAALHLPRLEVRKAILDLLYELVGLPQPEWTDEISVALDAVDPSDFQDSWRLNEGFVAAEGNAILPHLASTGPDIVEIHLALLLQCFLEAGLLDGLAEVIVTSDTFISVRATVLLGQLLHLIHLYLPPQLCSVSPALPSLMSQAAAGRPSALAAVAALRRHHAMLEARPATHSLFLDHIVQYCSGAFRERGEDNTKSRKEKDNASMAKPRDVRDGSIEFLDESDDEGEPKQRHSVGSRADVATRDTPLRNTAALVKSKSVSSRTSAAVNKVTKTKFFSIFERDSDNLMRCTLVMQNKDGNTWNWEIIRTILKENETNPLLKLSEGTHRAWAARIVSYLKPSANKFSHAELAAAARGQAAARAGCQLVRHLLRHNDADSQRLLEELFYDVSRQIEAIETGLKAHECLFSPQHMCNTMCQMYFLFIGQLCHTQTGLRLFKQTRIYENLLDLSTKTHHSCYVKLVISSLDYTIDSHPREILAKTLTCSIQASRLYATQFLNVLLRASRRSREVVRRKSKLKKNLEHLKAQRDDCDANGVDMDTWILQMLVGQIKDESKEVVKCALTILEEAYSVPAFIEKLIPLRSTLARNCNLERSADPRPQPNAAGDRAYLLWLMLEVAAITAASAPAVEDIAFLNRQLEFWTKSYNYRYARLVEASVHSAMSLGAMRALALRRRARPPPHLHAALAGGGPAATHLRHMLAAVLPEHCRTLQRKKCTSEQDIMDLKASLWAVGHTAAAAGGLHLLLSCTSGASGAGSTSGVSASGASETAPALVVRLARHSPVCSVRATAFYVLSLIGSTYDGANLLADLGWLCVRHTRHEQFPVIPEELLNGEPGVTSPDRRFDADASEHSDHTDHSAADSLHSDYARPGPTKAGSVDERDLDVVDRPEKHGRKSHTLPSQGWTHERPLPESRTADALQWPPRDPRPLMEGRVRNTSESSTSGVSSCDSFLGRYAIPDRILTLSPIPSSSSLYGMKSSSSSQRPKITDLQRRTSTSSFTAPDVASSPPSNMDMTGYATLKSLNKHRRPHLSESAATSSELDELSWLLADTNRRSARPFSSLRDRAKTTREKMTKLSLLDYDWKPLSLSEGRATTPLRAPLRRTAAAPARTNYQGICLPRDLMDVFSWDEEEKEETDTCKANSRLKPLIPSDSSVASVKTKPPPAIDRAKYPSFRPDDVVPSAAFFYASCVNSGAVGSSSLVARRALAAAATHRETLNYANPYTNHTIVSSAVPVPKSIAKLLEMNNKASPSNTGRESATATDSGTRDTVDGLSRSGEVTRMSKSNLSGTEEREEPRPPLDKPQLASGAPSETGTASSRAGVAGAAGVPGASGASGVAGPTLRYPHSPADCLACAPTRPPSAHELREAFFAVPDVGGGIGPEEPERGPRFEILRHAHLMANPIHLRQTRSALLSLKQRHPELFRSACIYSDVCALLARDTYMLCARRFLQELFLDTSFECFATEPAAMLARRGVAAVTQ